MAKGSVILPLLPEQIDFELNSVSLGFVQNTAPTGVILLDTDLNPISPVSITQIGNQFEFVVATGSSVPSLVEINGVAFKSLNPGDTLDILIENSLLVPIGTPDPANNRVDIADATVLIQKSDSTLIFSFDIAAEDLDSYNVADSVAVLKDTLGNTLSSTNIKATESEDIIAPDATFNLDNTSGATLFLGSIAAGDNETIIAPDGDIENSDASYTASVESGGLLILPDQTIEVNTVNEGAIPSVGTIEIDITDGTNPVTPNDVTIVGRKVTVEVPSGGAVMNVDFSADKLTADLGETITFTDLTDNSPTHWSWRFGSEGQSIVQNPTFSFLTTGFKDITLLAGKVGAGGVEIKNSYIEILLPLLLDAFPNAAAAYSLRKLRAAYTGSAIRVRRSSDNTEQDIGFNGSNRLDTTALLAFVGAGNGFVSTWYDQSGNGLNATQSTAGNQPQIVSSGVVLVENGNPSVSFNGSQFLETGAFTVNQPATQIGVGKIDNGYSTAVNYTLASSSNAANRMHVFYRNSGKYAMFAGLAIESTINTNANQFVFSALFNTTSSELRRNGTQIITGNAGSQNFGSNLLIGSQSAAGNTWLGVIQEFVFYPADQTSNFTAIETNINTYYNVF